MPLTPQLAAIRQAVIEGRILWKKHALQRMMERGVSRLSVKEAILNAAIIEHYPGD